MLKRKHYIVIALIVVITLTILNAPSQTVARFKLAISSVFLPLVGLSAWSHRAVEKAGEAVVPRSELLKQNDTLRRENEKLRLQLAQAEKTFEENDQLRTLFRWQQQSRLKVRLARVILGDPANWWRSVQIDLGARDGIVSNLPVLSPKGYLVGRISQVMLTRSQVLLLGDPNCKVAAKVETGRLEGGEAGIIGGSGPLDNGFVEMGFISKAANLKAGQQVKTSGRGGVFPENIPIGTIIDARLVDYGQSAVARVKLSADLGGLDLLWVRFP